jgi:hypothetical protein
LLDAVALGIDPAETGRALSIQERAYTSPIHYQPELRSWPQSASVEGGLQ